MSGSVAAPVTPGSPNDATERLRPVSMEEAVGYAGIECTHERLAEHSLVLKHDRLFMLVDPHGNIAPAGLCSLGLFQDDTRILSHYALSVHGGPPDLLSAQVPSTFGAQIDLAVSNLPFGGDRWDPRNVVHIRRELVLADRLVERVTLTGYFGTPEHYWVELELGCDFADIFEVRGWLRRERGQYYAPEPWAIAAGLRLSRPRRPAGPDAWCGSAGRPTASPSAARGGACGSRSSSRSSWSGKCTPTRAATGAYSPPDGLDDCREHARISVYRGVARAGTAGGTTDVDKFDALLHRAVDDLRALYVEVDGEKVISAGIPWYSTVFGRDSMITSLQTLPLNPEIALDTLRYLARRQGSREDPFTEEQPGKILHEIRRGEMARAGEIPHVPYFGSGGRYAALARAAARDLALDRRRRARPRAAAQRGAGARVDRPLRRSGRRRVRRVRPHVGQGAGEPGLEGFGRRRAVPRGQLPEPPIALVEVQGYVYDAKVRMAELFQVLGTGGAGRGAPARGGRLREPITAAFWLEELGTFALALDGRKRPIPTVTSNAGHLLWSRVPTPGGRPPAGRPLPRARVVLGLGHPHAERGACGRSTR